MPGKSKKGFFGKKRCTTYGEVADKALKGVMFLKGLINSELYTYTSTYNNTGCNTNGSVTNVTAIPQGDNADDRTGNSIFVKQCKMNLLFRIDPSGTEYNTNVRVMLVRDRQQVADAIPGIGSVLAQTTQYNVLIAGPNIGNKGRFTILYDRVFNLSDAKPSKHVKWTVNMKSHVRFNGTAGTDIQKNGLYWMMVSDSIVSNVSVHGDIRIKYHDN